jgi:hypothetical protein
VLSDWAVFDLGLFTWVKANVSDGEGLPFRIYRKMHTLTAYKKKTNDV